MRRAGADKEHALIVFFSQVRNGHIKRLTDNDIQSSVLEIMGRVAPFSCVL